MESIIRSAIRLAAAIISLAAVAPAAAQEPAYSKTYDACMDTAGATTADMRTCLNAEIDRWDKQLNAHYKAIRAKAESGRWADVRRAQIAWLRYRKANCDYYNDPRGGPAALLAGDTCFLRMTARRTLELKAILDRLTL